MRICCHLRRFQTPLREKSKPSCWPAPQDYLPLLERGSLGIGGGPTTDMQSITGYDATKQAAFLEALTRMMTTQKAGPYLKFYDAEV
jgi:hypothetical protein